MPARSQAFQHSSADGRSVVTASDAFASSYEPPNGPILNVFGGVHLNHCLSLQANYSGNRNNLTLTSIGSSASAYEQNRKRSQHSFAGDVVLYFRDRQSWQGRIFRCALERRFKSDSGELSLVRGALSLPPDRFSSTMVTLHVAVWDRSAANARVGFSLQLSRSHLAKPGQQQLTPPGQRNLAGFQNLFGFVRSLGAPVSGFETRHTGSRTRRSGLA